MISRILLLIVHAFCVLTTPRDHLKPLGSHLSLHSIPEMKEFPTPHYFYEWFVKSSQPVIFKSVLNTIVYPAYKKWNDEYLRKHFGEKTVAAERGKKETRNASDGFFCRFKSFLDTYRDLDLYMVDDLTQEMKEDVPMLSCLHCGGFQKALAMVVMWFSSGGTKSVLHSDSLDNINCLLDGSKDMIFIDKIYKDRVEATDFVKRKGYSKVDVDKVDLLRFPQLENIPWLHAHMVKGDCLFIPRKWYHQVNSYGNRNLAVNVWFHHIPWFNQTECDTEVKKTSYDAIVNYAKTTQEDYNRIHILQRFEGLDIVYRDEFYRRLKGSRDELDKVFDFLDSDGDDAISWNELNKVSEDQFMDRYRKYFLPVDMSDEELDAEEEPDEEQDEEPEVQQSGEDAKEGTNKDEL